MPHDELMAGPLGSSKHRYAGDTWTLRRRSPARNRMVTSGARVGVCSALPSLGAPMADPAPAVRGIYRPPTAPGVTALRLWSDHLQRLRTVYDDRFAREYGPWRPVVAQVADKFLACGILDHGFARIRCDACANGYLLAFSCKCRYFCPSCHAKRHAIWAQWLDATLRAPVPHRHGRHSHADRGARARDGHRPDAPPPAGTPAETFGVRDGPTGASHQSPSAPGPHRDRAAPGPRSGGPASRASGPEVTPLPVCRCSRGRRSGGILDRPRLRFLSRGHWIIGW